MHQRSERTVELIEYLSALRKRWWLIALLAVVGSTGAYVYAQTMAPQYRATSTVFVSTSGGQDPGELVQGSTYVRNVVNSYARLATMPVVLDPVIQELGLSTTARGLAERVSTDVPLDTMFIEVSVMSGSPGEAAEVANAITAQLARTVEEFSPSSDTGASSVTTQAASPAVPPRYPVSPNTRLLTATGGAGGLALGVALALILALLDTRVRTARDIPRFSAEAVLGSIPQSEGRQARRPLLLTQPDSPQAEAYRRLQTNLRYLDAAGPLDAIVITSAVPGEGKSSTSLNLAVAVAEKGQRVLLIDADLRRPSLDLYAGLEGGAGLTTVLIGRARLDAVVQPWAVPGLDILTSGEAPPNPSRLLDSPAMNELLATARASYDLVLIDSPPLLPVADAAVLARLTNGAVLVARSRKVRRTQVAEAIAALDAVGATCLGVVVNAVRKGEHPNRYAYDSASSRRDRGWRSLRRAPGRTGPAELDEWSRRAGVDHATARPSTTVPVRNAAAESTGPRAAKAQPSGSRARLVGGRSDSGAT